MKTFSIQPISIPWYMAPIIVAYAAGWLAVDYCRQRCQNR